MQQDKRQPYKYCIVPLCKNTNRNAPNKLFCVVPRGANIRKWCKIMKRDMISPSTYLYCCEDHFDLEEDTSNYIEYKIMNLQEQQKTGNRWDDSGKLRFSCLQPYTAFMADRGFKDIAYLLGKKDCTPIWPPCF